MKVETLFILALSLALAGATTTNSFFNTRPAISITPQKSEEEIHQSENGNTDFRLSSTNQGRTFSTSQNQYDTSASDPVIDATNVRYNGYQSGSVTTGLNTNYGYSGTNGYNNGGIVCTVCSNYDAVNSQRCCAFGFRQCCNVGIYPTPTVYNSWPYQNGGSYYNNQQKPGNCYIGGGGIYNHNAGFYYNRRSDDDEDVKLVKREAPLLRGGYQAYGTPTTYNNGWTSSHGQGYNTGGYPSWGYSNHGYQHGGNGIPPRPGGGGGGGYCRRNDYECPGIQKCCSGICSNPTATIG